ncbi:PREDICTED: uncharacterized protein LOC106548641 [Thamnophis sirtalis]|uniref:Uncharacterized protein LOC106548641 n=1 Tax=Thamnophis sirtalis TaxID=35019 RepID=A0A6I9YBQ9_9SAUR|nr:PREDICTED: uncharacterized protein LOC106548641 [Thamnophis sirtalis]
MIMAERLFGILAYVASSNVPYYRLISLLGDCRRFHLKFKETNLSTLQQFNALAHLRRLEQLTVETQGNPVVSFTLWKFYVLFRLSHFNLQKINGSEEKKRLTICNIAHHWEVQQSRLARKLPNPEHLQGEEPCQNNRNAACEFLEEEGRHGDFISQNSSAGQGILGSEVHASSTGQRWAKGLYEKAIDNSQSNSPTAPSINSDHLPKITLNSKESEANDNFPEKTDVADRIQIPYEASCEQQQPVTKQQKAGQTPKSVATQRTPLCRFNTIIIIYLFLVVLLLCSSGYIGLRIIQLEEQLISMGAWPELDLQHQYKAS